MSTASESPGTVSCLPPFQRTSHNFLCTALTRGVPPLTAQYLQTDFLKKRLESLEEASEWHGWRLTLAQKDEAAATEPSSRDRLVKRAIVYGPCCGYLGCISCS